MCAFCCKKNETPDKWSDNQVNAWFENKSWLGGWNIKPDVSINRRALALSCFHNRERWDKVFKFMKDSDFYSMKSGRYEIDGNKVYASVSEYMSKEWENTKYEGHKKYIDLQYIVKGSELIGIAPLSALKEITEPYVDDKDIYFMTVDRDEKYQAAPDRFFIFFPDDLHCPCMKDETSGLVKKVVVKIAIE